MSTATTNELTEIEEARRGKLIADALFVRRDENCEARKQSGWIKTAWGTKTHLGLYRMLKRLIEDGE